ncbi:hypothetical protein B0A62_07975 [Flavobacterium hydatis]|jgi:hypothetical protein|uniref:Uncharacterized protein n=1 Tax=Flavobacterium hydatis TaxID=991 RepID=A0A085ZE62_FLAHY|nr:hypothetical protein IW20_25030 [Flavobacterium hydatis]OXA95239.1 hypothetical protein B0A62_07975 [Flavobacterium hydatis]
MLMEFIITFIRRNKFFSTLFFTSLAFNLKLDVISDFANTAGKQFSLLNVFIKQLIFYIPKLNNQNVQYRRDYRCCLFDNNT